MNDAVVESCWSSDYPELDQQIKPNSAVNLSENGVDTDCNIPCLDMKSNGFVNEDYINKESNIEPASFVGSEFMSSYGAHESTRVESQSSEGITNNDPLALDVDKKLNTESEYSVILDDNLCEICGEVYPSTKSYHCERDDEAVFQEKRSLTVNSIPKRSPGKLGIRVETELIEDVHPDHSLCPYCNVVYDYVVLSDHISEHSKLPYICDRCGNFYSSEEEFCEHEKKHGDTVLCMSCFKVCDDDIDLIAHATVRSLPLECLQCQNMFTSHCAMHSHRATCSPKKTLNNMNNPKIKCSQCSMVFANQQRLDDHFRQHTGERPFSCEHCLQTYSRKDNLNRHLRKNRIEEGLVCKCNSCHIEFSSKCSLKKHYTTEHPEQPVDQYMKVASAPEPPDSIVMNGRSLRSRIPSNEQIILESTSPQTQTPTSEDVNLSNDSEPIRFSCELCAKTFAFRKSLTNHIRTVHSQDNLPHACHLCNRTFSDEVLLNRHITWHKGAQHQCRTCGISYSHSKHLQRHMKKVHSLKKDISDAPVESDSNEASTANPVKSESLSSTENTEGVIKSEITSPKKEKQIISRTVPNDTVVTPSPKKEKQIISRTVPNDAVATPSSVQNFLTYAELLKIVEKASKPYACQVCGKLTDSKRNYLEHYMSHSKERPFKCDICGQGFIRERRMLDHKVEHGRDVKKRKVELNEDSSMPDDKTYLRPRLDTSAAHEKGKTLLRPRIDDSTYLAKFAHLSFKTPSIFLNRFDLYPPTSEGLVQSSSSMVHFRCDNCSRVFSRKSALVSHQKTCTCNSPMSTEIPRARRSKPFKYLMSFEKQDKIVVYGMEHSISVVNGEQHFTCGVCGRSFDKKNFIFKHTLIHVKDKPFKCALCMNRGFMTRNSLKKHFRKCHKGLTIDKDGNVVQKDGTTAIPTNIWSEQPSLNNVQTSLLADRLNQGYAENGISKSPEHITVECDLNDMLNMFDSDIVIEKEETMDTPSFQITTPANTFGQISYPVHTVFISQPAGLRHLPTDVEMPFMDTYSNYQLNDVTMNHFLESPDVEMENTQPAVKSASSLAAPEEVFLTCGQCNTSFETKEEMFKHYVAHDMANDPIKCAICDKEFVRRQYLQMHAMMHARPKKFQCTYCPKSFRAKRDMDDHIRTHTGEKPFGCEYCGRKFRVRKQLYAHRKLHVQAFQCAKCSASFSIEWSLKRHEKLCFQGNADALPAGDEIIIQDEKGTIMQEMLYPSISPNMIVGEVSLTEPEIKTEVLNYTDDSSVS